MFVLDVLIVLGYAFLCCVTFIVEFCLWVTLLLVVVSSDCFGLWWCCCCWCFVRLFCGLLVSCYVWFVLFCRCLRGCVLFSAAVVWLDDCCFKDLRCCFDALF